MAPESPESPGRGSARTSTYEQKLEHVLAAGARVIAREGYGQATIRQVASEAGMSIAGLYHYFSSKEDLLYRIQHHTFDSILNRLSEMLEGLPAARERLRAVVVNHLEHFIAHMDNLKVCTHEMRSLSGEFYERVRVLRQKYHHITLAIVEEISREVRARDGARPGVDPFLATMYLFGMLNWIYMWYPREGGEPLERLAEQLVTLFLDGYLSGSPNGDPAGESR